MTTPAPLFSDPLIIGDVIVVAMQSEVGVLQGYDLETGEQEWTYLPPES
jgi:hypothetical protein